MAQFTADDVNTDWGFYGTLADWGNVSRSQVMGIYNYVVDLLGGDPEKAKAYLDSTAGRHFVDSLTFFAEKESAGAEEIKSAIAQAKADPRAGKFFSSFSRPQRRESKMKITPTQMVENMLAESAIAAFVDELKAACARTGVGKIVDLNLMEPDQVAEVTVQLTTGEVITCHVAANPDGTFDFAKANAEGDYEDIQPFKDVADFIAKLP